MPVKRLIGEVLRSKGYYLPLRDITNNYAIEILKSFRIPVYKKSELLKRLAGLVSIGGNSVEEEEKLYSP